jgi:hypothetical protein
VNQSQFKRTVPQSGAVHSSVASMQHAAKIVVGARRFTDHALLR